MSKISEEALAAATKALEFHLPDGAYETGCRARCSYHGDELAEHLVAHILEAAAPHMLAEAWELGAKAERRWRIQFTKGVDPADPMNPYRPTP